MNDANALARLYAADAVLESPAVPLLMKKSHGICRGRDEIWRLFDIIARRKPIGHLQRGGYLTDGRQPHAARDLAGHADDQHAGHQPADVAPRCRERSERDEQRRRRGIKESVTQLLARPRA